MLEEVKTLSKHTSIYGVAEVAKKAIGFLMIPVYTRFLMPSDYGLLELLDLTVNVIEMLIGIRLGAALVRFHHTCQSEGEQQEYYTTALISAAVISIVFLAVLMLLSGKLSGVISGSAQNSPAFRVVFICLTLQSIYLVGESYLIARKKSALYSILSIITLVTTLSLNILFLIKFNMGIYAILLSMLIAKVLNAILVLTITLKKVKLSFSVTKLKAMALYGAPLIPASLAMFAIHFSDRFFVQKFCDLSQLGIYSLGYKFGMIISVIVYQPFFRTWNAQRFEIIKIPGHHKVLSRFFTYFTMISIFAGLCISVYIREVIQLMAPVEYFGAAHFVALITLSYIFYGMSMFFSLGNNITYKTKYEAYIQMAAAVLNIAMNFLFIEKYGVMGAAWATLITFFLLWIMSMVNSQMLYPIPIEVKRVALLFSIAGAIYAISLFVEGGILLPLVIKTILIALFPAILGLFGFFKPEEIHNGKRLLNKIMIGIGIKRVVHE